MHNILKGFDCKTSLKPHAGNVQEVCKPWMTSRQIKAKHKEETNDSNQTFDVINVKPLRTISSQISIINFQKTWSSKSIKHRTISLPSLKENLGQFFPYCY